MPKKKMTLAQARIILHRNKICTIHGVEKITNAEGTYCERCKIARENEEIKLLHQAMKVFGF